MTGKVAGLDRTAAQVWVGMLAVAAVALAFAAFQIASAALPVMTGSNEWLTDLTETSIAQFTQGDGEGLPALLRSVEEGGDDTRRAVGVARGVGRFAPLSAGCRRSTT